MASTAACRGCSSGSTTKPDIVCLQEIKTTGLKLAWFERLNARALRKGKPVVQAGDLNVAPTKADIYNEWLWRLDAVVQPETRAAFGRLLEQGWIDATRHLHPDERIYTFWVNDAAFRRNAGFRMDFLLSNGA